MVGSKTRYSIYVSERVESYVGLDSVTFTNIIYNTISLFNISVYYFGIMNKKNKLILMDNRLFRYVYQQKKKKIC